MDTTFASFFSSLDSDPSTGYLEDALLGIKGRSKRPRLLYSIDNVKRCESYNTPWEISEDYCCMSEDTLVNEVSDGCRSTSSSLRTDDETMIKEMKTPQKALSEWKTLDFPSLDVTGLANVNSISDKNRAMTIYSSHSMPSAEDDESNKATSSLVYPFALVKPGGAEGDVTLNDINKKILMAPTRPVRHPVGDFACRPCVSVDGPGLSGKAVVALTIIQTQGKGTITIMRTKG